MLLAAKVIGEPLVVSNTGLGLRKIAESVTLCFLGVWVSDSDVPSESAGSRELEFRCAVANAIGPRCRCRRSSPDGLRKVLRKRRIWSL